MSSQWSLDSCFASVVDREAAASLTRETSLIARRSPRLRPLSRALPNTCSFWKQVRICRENLCSRLSNSSSKTKIVNGVLVRLRPFSMKVNSHDQVCRAEVITAVRLTANQRGNFMVGCGGLIHTALAHNSIRLRK